MNNNALVSVVIPCYNHQDFIQDAIQSVIDQSYQNIELIIIDDGSKDDSVAKIEQMVEVCEQRFTRFEFRYRPNKGLSATLNEAIEWCQGKYFAGLASDDIILPNKTEVQVKYLEQYSKVVAVFGGIQLIDENNKKLARRVKDARAYEFKEIIMHKFELPAPTQMIRLEILKQVGGYDPNIAVEDWYMWLKLSEIGELYYLDQVFALYRQHDHNFSKGTEKMLQARDEVVKCFQHSQYYEKAFRKIKWLNTRVYYYNSKDEKLKWLLKLYSIWPTKTANMLINEVIKKVKNK